jgi:hypothetical protein
LEEFLNWVNQGRPEYYAVDGLEWERKVAYYVGLFNEFSYYSYDEYIYDDKT